MNRITSLNYMKDRIYMNSKKKINKHLLFDILTKCVYGIMLSEKLQTTQHINDELIIGYINIDKKLNEIIDDYFNNKSYAMNIINQLKTDMSSKKYNQKLLQEYFDDVIDSISVRNIVVNEMQNYKTTLEIQ